MREHAEMNFGLLRVSGPTPEARSQSPFEPRDRALDLRPLAVLKFGKPPVHLSAVRSFCPAASTSSVQRDNRASNAQVLSGVGVVVFGVVAAVAQQRVQRATPARGAGRGLELRRILAGALADVGRQEQVAGRLQHGGQLGPGQAAVALPLPPDEVAAAVPALVAGGVDGGPRLGRDQAALLGLANRLREECIDPFFCSRRWAAFCRVEWSGTWARPRARRRSDQSDRSCSMPR